MKNTENVTLADYRGLSDELIKNFMSDHSLYDGTWWLDAFKRFLRKENPWNVKVWNHWKLITFGGPDATAKKLIKLCRKDGSRVIDNYPYHLLKNLETTKEANSAFLMVCPVKMLGFENQTTICEINKRIIDLGFKLLTNEMVYNLFYQVEYFHEFIHMAMEPIELTDGQKIYFALKRTIIQCAASVPLPVGYNVVFVQNNEQQTE